MTFNYRQYVEMINDKLDEYGGTIYYYQKIDGKVDLITGVNTYNEIMTPIKGLITPYSSTQSPYSLTIIDGDDVQRGDKRVYIKATNGKPSLSDYLIIDGTSYKILGVQEVSFDGNVVLLYELQVRTSTIVGGTSVDITSLTLGDVPVGNIVIDSYALTNSPEWRVIAHDHHGTGITTLMTNLIWAWASFNGSYEGMGYAPDTPWRMSNMRTYLVNDFGDDYLSAQFQEILKTVDIETKTNVWPDKISLLSREELFNVMMGASSGSYIPYFASDAYRIGRWKEDDSDQMWWTRDVVSWTAPKGTIGVVKSNGTFGSYSDASRAGVRPIIFLSSEHTVLLESDGKYSIQY